MMKIIRFIVPNLVQKARSHHALSRHGKPRCKKLLKPSGLRRDDNSFLCSQKSQHSPSAAALERSQAIEQAIRERRLTESLELLEQSGIEGELAIFILQGLQINQKPRPG